MHCAFVDINVDGWDRAVEGEDDLRQREERDKVNEVHRGKSNQYTLNKELQAAKQSLGVLKR